MMRCVSEHDASITYIGIALARLHAKPKLERRANLCYCARSIYQYSHSAANQHLTSTVVLPSLRPSVARDDRCTQRSMPSSAHKSSQNRVGAASEFTVVRRDTVGVASGMRRGCAGAAPGLRRECAGDAPGMRRGCFAIASERAQNKSSMPFVWRIDF